MNIRNSVLATGVAFGIYEVVDIPDTGVPALVVALLFSGLTAWIWRLRRGAGTTVPLAVAAALAAALAGSASAATQARTLQFLSVQQSASFTPNGPPAVGSRIVFADAIYNRVPQFGQPAGRRVGHVEGVCTIVTTAVAQCLITAHVPNGQIVVAGSMRLSRGPETNHFAIVGGAGAYGSVRGTVVSRDLSETKSVVTLKLAA